MTKKLILLIAAFFAVTTIFAQGIFFKKGLRFAEIKRQAIQENKYIFVDVGATWCVPCHMMEDNVFRKDSVGDFFNKNFLCMKVQANKSPTDNREIKSLYADAENVLKTYSVAAYPTYLFFSPQGELVYRYVGTALPGEFIKVGQNALNPRLSVKFQLEQFENHQLPIAEEGKLAMFLLLQDHDREAQVVAKDYNTRFLNNAADTTLKSEANLTFISMFPLLLVPADAYFKLYYNHGNVLDSLTNNPGHAYRLTNRVIIMSEVWARLYENGTKKIKAPYPDWEKINDAIAAKYSTERAARILPLEKYRFYCQAGDKPQIVQCSVKLIKDPQFNNSDKYADLINQAAYHVFEYGNDKNDLDAAIQWTQKFLAHSPDDFEVVNTYAGLIYKKGEKKEALRVAQKSIALLTKNGERSDKETLLPIYRYNLNQMKINAGSASFKRAVDNMVAF